MSTRKSTNKAPTDSPVSTSSDTSSTRSTTTRSSIQTPGSESDITDCNITTDSKRPRRTNVRTPTTPSSSGKKRADDISETTSVGGDVDDDKSVKSLADDTKSEDGKKTDSLTDSPVKAARKRKVFDKTAIVTRKSAMELANSTKRVLRDRRNSTGKCEFLENEPKKRSTKKSTSSTPEPPTSMKRKRENSTKVEEDTKRFEKIIKLEPTEPEDVQKVEEEVNEERTVKSPELQEEDQLKLLVEETDSKDDELVEVVEIKQEIDEDTEDVPMEENNSKELDEEQDLLDQSESLSKNSTEVVEDNKDDIKLSDSEITIAKLFVEEKNSKNLSLSSSKKKKSEDQKVVEISPSLSSDVDKEIIVRKEEVKVEEDSKFESYERPRRGRAKKLLDSLTTPTKRGGRKSDKLNSDTFDNKAKMGRKIQQNSPSSEANKTEESAKSDESTTKSKSDVESPEIEKKIVTQDTAANCIQNPLIVDTSSTASMTAEKAPAGTSTDQISEKAASLSPELVSEGVNVVSVKQFYKKPEFLENNLGIEKDPKLGEIVQEVEKSKDVSENPDILMPSNSTDLIVEKAIEITETSPDCSGDSLKEGERLVLDDSTEEDGNNSINKEGNHDATEITPDYMNSENSNLTKLEVEEEGTLSNNDAAIAENVDALQTNCDSINRITAVDSNGQKEEDVCEGDTEIKDKTVCNKNSTEEIEISENQHKLTEEIEVDIRENQETLTEDISPEKLEEEDNVSSDNHVEVETEKEGAQQGLTDIDSEEVLEVIGNDINVETVENEDEIVESKLSVQENIMNVDDEVNENKENVNEIIIEDKENVTTPKKVSMLLFQTHFTGIEFMFSFAHV